LIPFNDELREKALFLTVKLGIGTFATTVRVERPPLPADCFRRAMTAMRIDGLIGNDLLYDYVVVLDYERNVLTLYESLDPELTKSWTEVRVFSLSHRPFVPVVVELESGAAQTVPALLDTGMPEPQGVHLRTGSGVPLPTDAISMHGCTQSGSLEHYARVRSIEFAGYKLFEVLAKFSEQPTTSHRPSLLGSGLLRRFHVVLDLAGGRLFVTPNASFDEPFELTMLGISFTTRKIREGLFVGAVLPSSPAVDAGIEPGDQLIAVDREPVDMSRLSDYTRRFRQGVGHVIELRFRREDVEYDVTVRLRRIL
jgi:membrane-associated protease RseP (regulator of RpoE activity)